MSWWFDGGGLHGLGLYEANISWWCAFPWRSLIQIHCMPNVAFPGRKQVQAIKPFVTATYPSIDYSLRKYC
jgi:hypothetical protein